MAALRPGTPALPPGGPIPQRPATPMVQPGTWAAPQGFAELEHKGWHFRSHTRSAGRPSKEVGPVREPLPETMYGENFLEVEYVPTGTTLRFECADALARWGDAEQAITERLGGEPEYRGTTAVHMPQPAGVAPIGEVVPSELALPVERYLAHDEVLFFDDVVLYEDRHKDGYTKLQAKIRVMQDRFLILLRLFQKNMAVGVRLVDTRYAHEFGEAVVISDSEVRCKTIEEIGKVPAGQVEADAVYQMVEPCFRIDEKFVIRND